MGHKPIYWQYFGLSASAYREKIRLYEDNPDEIAELEFDDRIEIDIDYLFCLFEIGRYDRYISKSDPAIEWVIEENIYKMRGINIFEELIFRKAACYYQLHQYTKASDLLKQLIRMNNENPYFIGLYTICVRKLHNDIYLSIKAMAIACFMIVLGITLARIFIEPLFQHYFAPFIVLRTALFLGGILLLAGMEVYFQYRIYKETRMFSYQVLNKIFGI